MSKLKRELSPEFRDEFVIVIGGKKGKEAVKYEGLLALAHEEKDFGHIESYITQYPSAENKWTAFARAEIFNKEGKRIGMEEADANAQNCGKMTAASYPRMALTRSKGRALRDYLNIGMVTAEEVPSVFEPEKADPKIIGKIKKIAKKHKIEKEKLYDMMFEQTGYEQFNELPQEDADFFLNFLQKKYANDDEQFDA